MAYLEFELLRVKFSLIYFPIAELGLEFFQIGKWSHNLANSVFYTYYAYKSF